MSSNAESRAGYADQRRRVGICRYQDGAYTERDDTLAIERPLEIQVAGAQPVVTMRTPGDDLELAAGLMHGEGVVHVPDEIVYLDHAPDEADVVRLMLKPSARERLDHIERSTVVTSACGVCGKPSFEAPKPHATDDDPSHWMMTPAELTALPDRLREAQGVFEETGGLHAAGLFDSDRHLIAVREDVGRHNALDKLIGWALLNGRLPLADHAVMLSGRASYELVQKSVAADVTLIAAISAPSTYAVDLAATFDATLVGFVRGHRFNVYTGARRIEGAN
ncbi:formate dehydrogenase accessory sulfurtransferase FdhD [Salinisphaera orenii]|uniref:formate dehydrogenase accessory sulfurtransferase FdhD n=1 Tax=Salinisphaera orenii TaxID=856731 RepID=UPI00296EF731